MLPDLDALPAREPSTSVRWQSEKFRLELLGWVVAALGTTEAAVRSFEPLKMRPWSTVWVLTTDQGRFFAKQNCRSQGFEARLVAMLADLASGRVAAPVAVDGDRGFLLTADQSPVLGEVGTDVEGWCAVVAGWAEVQRRVVAGPGSLDRMGVTAMPAGGAAELLERRTALLASISGPLRLEPADADRLRCLGPTVLGWADEVARLELPLALNHNDLHAWNVFAPSGGRGLRFFDLGDSVLGDPLGALLVPLRTLAVELGAGPGDVRVRRVADAFLEVWSDLVPATQLRAAVPAALRLACLARHESWLRCTASMTAAELATYAEAPVRNLLAVANEPPVRF